MGMSLDIVKIKDKSNKHCPSGEVDYDVDIGFEGGTRAEERKFNDWHYDYKGEMDYVQCPGSMCCGASFWRPKDIDDFIKWVELRIGKEGWGRSLILSLEIMKYDEDLFFEYS